MSDRESDREEAGAREMEREELDLKRCFAEFDVIHTIISSEDRVRRITREVLEDFAGAS